MFDNVRNMEFLDQITLLNEITASKDVATLPGLIELLQRPIGDTSIDYMVVNAINAVLGTHEEKVVEGLGGGMDNYRTLCIRVAGERGFTSAVPELIRLAENERDPDRLLEILSTLSRIGDPRALPVFRKNIDHEDPFIQSSCIVALGKLHDTASIGLFKGLITDSDAPDRYEECDLTTWKAVEALAGFNTDDTTRFLASRLHHRNPTVRRIITDSLVAIGTDAIASLQEVLKTGDTDLRILAANVIGFIADKAGADGLVEALDKGFASDANVRYAVYEALGKVGTMKGLVSLMDGLEEDDEMILMAVMGGLELHVNPGMAKSLAAALLVGDGHSVKLARALIATKATTLFTTLFENRGVAEQLTRALVASRDPDVVATFRQALESIDTPYALEVLPTLSTATAQGPKALAADDSRSMCAMHRTILTDLGFTPYLAANGEEAYEYIDQGTKFDIVITDMNMPIMDGIELVSKIRNTPGCSNLPIIMVTTESEASQQKLATKSGVSAFVTKPFKPDVLKATIKKLLG